MSYLRLETAIERAAVKEFECGKGSFPECDSKVTNTIR
jgi:hypothetical protein